MNLPEKNTIIKHKKNIRATKKTRLSLRPLSASIRMLLTGPIVLGGLTVSLNATAALPIPKPPGAWATRSALALPVVDGSWSHIGNKLWRSGTTEAKYGNKTLTIKQKDGKVILSWDSFDIDVSHLVEFKQPSSTSIALNRIVNTAPPSKILGTLKANGQIYLINNNGFLFGANSVVDVNTLVVSTLNISDDVFKRGITKVFSSDGSAAFSGNGYGNKDVYLRNPQSKDYIRDAAGHRIKIGIQVDKGAQIRSDNSGRVIMVAPKITNKGTITSPDGQVILAAATDEVYLQESNSKDSVRGLKVGLKTGGEVSNLGNIITARGNTTLMGFAVNQQGLISATTSVRVNGSIILRAGEKGGKDPGVTNSIALLPASTTIRASEQDDGLGTQAKVTLADGSVTQVLPEIKDKTAMAGTTTQPSLIKMVGKIVHFESGSAVIAPSGEVDVTATETPHTPGPTGTGNDSAIIMDPGSLVDVAGLRSVGKTMESNVIQVELRANALADAPVQRNKNSFLYGKKISVDIRDGTPLANIQPALDGIKTTVAERSVKGGTVTFSSQGAVVLKKGSEVNISGGAIHFKAGYINTTQLLGEHGKIYDISKAGPDLRYTGILGVITKEYKKWGVTITRKVSGPFNQGRFESAYTEGQKAGTFTIKANSDKMLLNGDIIAKTVNGRRQRLASQRAAGGTLNVNLAYLGGKYQTLVFQNNKDLNSPDLDMLKPAQGKGGKPAAPPPLIIDADAFRRNGLQNVTYTTNGRIVLPKNLDMTLSDGGDFSLTSKLNSIDLNGKIIGHGTNVSLKTIHKGQNVVLGKNALIDTSGRWVNDSLAAKPVPDFEGVFIDAGNVNISSKLASVIMNKGSLIRTNGGAWLTDQGKLKTGRGGDVSLAASTDSNNYGTLILDGRFEGFSFANSGTLSLGAPEFRFVPVIPGNGGSDPSVPGPVYIPEDFVRQSGFSTYKFSSTLNGITFESGVLLQPSQENLVLNSLDVVSTASASDVSSVSTRQRLADEIRKPVDLSFSYKDPSPRSNLQQTKAIFMQPGTRIQTDVGAKVSFSSSSSLYMNGVIQAPAGQISLNITGPEGTEPGYIPAQGIWLGPGSVLSTAGVFVPTSNVIPGLRQGRLLDGGDVTLKAIRGFIVMDKTALIDVSGASAVLDQPDTTYQGPGERLQKTPRASSAGKVSLVAAEGIIPGGTILGRANTSLGAEGGRLKVGAASRGASNASLKNTNSSANPFIETPRKIMISQDRPSSLKTLPRQGEAMADEANGYTWLDSALLNHSGFDSLDLNAENIVFTGDSRIIARRAVKLNASILSWQRESTADTGLAAILSPYVALGTTGRVINAGDATSGDGRLRVEADMIDLLGGVSLQGFDQARLNSNTDIRVRGAQHSRLFSKSLNTQGRWSSRGRLELNADRVYPASLSDYSINADQVVIAKHSRNEEDLRAIFGRDAASIIDNISQAHPSTPILSAGGRLAIQAKTISQTGELRAPLGEISLKADSLLSLEAGSLTSTSAQGQVIPLGQTAQSGQDWQYNFSTSDTLRMLRPPEKRILLSSNDVRLNKGAVIDMNGGGDLQAWEFIKGPGGSQDIFDSSGTAFAVLPGFSGYAPYDQKESQAAANLKKSAVFSDFSHYAHYDKKGNRVAAGLTPGDTVYLSAVGDLPAGEYARLPARYALLDGAYLVTPLKGYTGMVPGETSQLMDRTPVVAGQYRVAGTGIHGQDWNGFKVETRQQARLHSEILLTRANRFYTDRAQANETRVPFLPQDAGQLAITALSRLKLAGDLRNQAKGPGRGGRLDIEATNLAVVSRRSAPGVNSDRVELLANNLNQLGMESLLLGGIRKQTDAGTRITVGTRTVTVETNTGKTGDTLNLKGTEILLAAQDSIDLKRGVTVQAEGKGGLGADTLVVKGDGALVRVSAGAQVSVSRSGSKGDKGTINIDKGARLAANSAMLLDASHETNINGKLKIDHGSLNVGAGRINLGDAPISAPGLILDRDLLDSLNLSELVMTARKGIYAYGNVDFNFDSVVFDGAGIVSKGNAGNHFAIQADRLRFTNSSFGTVDNSASTAGGVFTVKARQIELGKGDYTLAGFKTVSMAASEQIIGTGKSSLSIKADVNLKTPLISSGNGADTRIDAGGHAFVINRLATDKPLAAAGIGGRLSINADSISDRGAILLPAGILDLKASHSLLIDNALIDVSGVSKSFQGDIKTAPGGKVVLDSELANVELGSGARINLSAADQGGDAGTLQVTTPQGEFIWQGTVSATAAKGKGGRFDLNEQSMSGPFSALNSKLAGAGFDEAVSLRLGRGDINIAKADTLRAHEVSLTADTGNVRVAGAIDARGKDGGRVELSAGDNLTLSGRIDASATSNDGNGGTVKLTAIDSNQDGVGQIDVTGEINVAGGGRGKGGKVEYYALRRDSNGDGQNDEVAIAHAGTVTGAAAVNYVPVRIYDGVSAVDQSWLNQWQSDTQAYMAFSDAIDQRLNGNGNNHGRILPGLLIRSNGDMSIDTAMDFSGWRYGKDHTPGDITFSAKDNLRINQDISDGFKREVLSTYGGYYKLVLDDKLMSGESWAYGFVAGADRQSANPMDVNRGVGDITLADNTKVRTGTGSIDIASGHDLTFGNDASVIYTAGQATDRRGLSFGDLSTPYYMQYPRDGGDIRIRTGGNMKGAISKQSIRAWLKSMGNWSRTGPHQGEHPTAWGLGLSNVKLYINKVPAPTPTRAFRRGIGALGGGKVDIRVAGDMQDVSVMIPTSGRPLGKSRSSNPAVLDFNENRFEISGGGSLNVNAGGNINGGVFYLGRGKGAIRTEGGLLKGANQAYPVFAMGDTQFNIISRKDLGIGAAFDPLMDPQSTSVQKKASDSYFFTYSAASRLALTSVAGDIRLANNGYYTDTGYNDISRTYMIYPASLSASSLTGDVLFNSTIHLFPSARGQLELLAANSITGGGVWMSDANPALIPNAEFPYIKPPSLSAFDLESGLYQNFIDYSSSSLLHAATPLHAGDKQPVKIVAEKGSITLSVNVPKKAEVYAGRDIVNSTFTIQHLAAKDRSYIVAGRDIRYGIIRNYTGAIDSGSRKMKISGPGQLLVQAGRNIDLGASGGITSIGNTKNPALANRGADVTLIAGVRNNMDYAGFARTYINQSDQYTAALRTFVNDGVINFDQTAGAAVSSTEANSLRKTFAGFKPQKQQEFLRALFLREIRDVGVKSAKAGGNFYQPAYDAIASLFPGSYAGDITLFFSQIKTLEGGSIQLLAPGGGVNAGLASSEGLDKGANELGIIVQREGKIDAFVRDNFAVNVSRVFTLGGGDIMIFASKGNIDAGRGAKSSLAAPAPIISYDEKGNLQVEYPPVVQGSGIRTFASGKTNAGDVYLFAPQGKIDAGDAGIGCNTCVLGAPTIINAGNIDIGGVSVGVPTASVSLAAGLTGVSNLSASSNKVAEESTSSIGRLSKNSGFGTTPMGFLNVELVGFGGGVTTPASKPAGKIKYTK